ncbi:hypothetical protein JCM9743_22010 [Natrinema sp. JCM 9743]
MEGSPTLSVRFGRVQLFGMRVPAVDDECLSVYVPREIAREEHRSARDILGVSDPARRDRLRDRLEFAQGGPRIATGTYSRN